MNQLWHGQKYLNNRQKMADYFRGDFQWTEYKSLYIKDEFFRSAFFNQSTV